MISIHAPREGGDGKLPGTQHSPPYFNPRPPRGGRPNSADSSAKAVLFQSTPPARGATTYRRHDDYMAYISIHAPREGGDMGLPFLVDNDIKFQSTPPARGATELWLESLRQGCISIHAPREGGDTGATSAAGIKSNFNPRPPRGGRHTRCASLICQYQFQSTPPARGATNTLCDTGDINAISIHAPREGGDSKIRSDRAKVDISIHAPREGGDLRVMMMLPPSKISIHAPREGGDRDPSGGSGHHADFNPRPPRGGRHRRCASRSRRPYFNPRPPRGGRLHEGAKGLPFLDFNPRPPRGGRPSAF